MRFLLTAGLLLAAALGETGLSAPSAPPLLVGRATVLPPSEGPVLARAVSGYSTPDAAALRRLERDLPASLAGYDRQYLGVVQGGRRLILINGFRAILAPEFTGGGRDWHRYAVLVCEGGGDFFQATYEPRTRRSVGPDFNGVG